MRRTDWTALTLVVCAVVTASVAVAAEKGPCADDAARLCPGKSNPKVVAECLQLQIGEVSPGCVALLNRTAPAAPPAAGACSSDIRKHCKGIAPGEGRLRDCLQQHVAELSPACAAAIKPKPAAPASKAAAPSGGPCAADTTRFCSGVAPGAGRLRACLLDHEKELSPACSAALPSGPLRKLHTACGEDLGRHCAGVSAGEGRLEACLKEHRAELSASCKAHLGGE